MERSGLTEIAELNRLELCCLYISFWRSLFKMLFDVDSACHLLMCMKL